jgi:uncharacterized protein DUF2786
MNPIFNKIRKLLALADASRNSSEAEAQAAALKVQELLQDHGLTLAELEAAGGTTDDTGRRKEATDRRALYAWQRDLMGQLADNNFCLHHVREAKLTRPGHGSRLFTTKAHVLVGRNLNVNATVAVYDYLLDALDRIAREQGFMSNRRDASAFFEGAVPRLVSRREKEAAQEAARRNAPTGGNALVLSDLYGNEHDLNNDTLNGFPAGTTAARRRERAEQEAARKVEEARLKANGVEAVEAFYLSHGYSPENAKSYAIQYHAKQDRPTRRGGRGWARGWTKVDENASAKRNSAAYRAGRKAGDEVGLDTQVTAVKTKVLK